jgi:hypothetical protein
MAQTHGDIAGLEPFLQTIVGHINDLVGKLDGKGMLVFVLAHNTILPDFWLNDGNE